MTISIADRINADENNKASVANNSWQVRAARDSSATLEQRGATQIEALTYADLSYRPLKVDDLAGRSTGEIRLMRNIPFAVHGKEFESPELKDIFNRQPWYRVNPLFRESDLSKMEKRNVEYLHIYELDNDLNNSRQKYADPDIVPEDTTGLLFAHADRQALTQFDLARLSDQDLRIAKNEILARHGHQFSAPDLKQRFESLPWYRPNLDQTQERLSFMEQRNLEFIHIEENDRQL